MFNLFSNLLGSKSPTTDAVNTSEYTKPESPTNSTTLYPSANGLLYLYSDGKESLLGPVNLLITPTLWPPTKQLKFLFDNNPEINANLDIPLQLFLLSTGFNCVIDKKVYRFQYTDPTDVLRMNGTICRSIFISAHGYDATDDISAINWVSQQTNNISIPLPDPIENITSQLENTYITKQKPKSPQKGLRDIEGKIEMKIKGDYYFFDEKIQSFDLLRPGVYFIISNLYPDSNKFFRRKIYITDDQFILSDCEIKNSIAPTFYVSKMTGIMSVVWSLSVDNESYLWSFIFPDDDAFVKTKTLVIKSIYEYQSKKNFPKIPKNRNGLFLLMMETATIKRVDHQKVNPREVVLNLKVQRSPKKILLKIQVLKRMMKTQKIQF